LLFSNQPADPALPYLILLFGDRGYDECEVIRQSHLFEFSPEVFVERAVKFVKARLIAKSRNHAGWGDVRELVECVHTDSSGIALYNLVRQVFQVYRRAPDIEQCDVSAAPYGSSL
jgi:hypothetical protein